MVSGAGWFQNPNLETGVESTKQDASRLAYAFPADFSAVHPTLSQP